MKLKYRGNRNAIYEAEQWFPGDSKNDERMHVQLHESGVYYFVDDDYVTPIDPGDYIVLTPGENPDDGRTVGEVYLPDTFERLFEPVYEDASQRESLETESAQRDDDLLPVTEEWLLGLGWVRKGAIGVESRFIVDRLVEPGLEFYRSFIDEDEGNCAVWVLNYNLMVNNPTRGHVKIFTTWMKHDERLPSVVTPEPVATTEEDWVET